ncbi:hypothetical protein PC9H_001441 [Pleurotus ostreatus]|uniref:Uncharacterized protein n=1 Tax=Pleurotus ostreatus TaxID=5322 RepID=A0A8H7A6N5_PLEOS|nr:uncharacterized protein PC9H_001441 [Pleurotus ostreatus]KAF7441092.1 hypothetical protein PC9H_001441 [Pleurotus ostreatus]KAJ8699425.1 hypothetical protein PTI98_002540 [Pleurotus ostreatus]
MSTNPNSKGSGSRGGLGDRVRGGFQAVHGVGDNIRGTALGLVDTATGDGVANDEIARRGRVETSEGFAKLMGRGGSVSGNTTSHPHTAATGTGGGVGHAHDPLAGNVPDQTSRPVPPVPSSNQPTDIPTGQQYNEGAYGGVPAAGGSRTNGPGYGIVAGAGRSGPVEGAGSAGYDSEWTEWTHTQKNHPTGPGEVVESGRTRGDRVGAEGPVLG